MNDTLQKTALELIAMIASGALKDDDDTNSALHRIQDITERVLTKGENEPQT